MDKILVGLDASERAPVILDRAVALAKRTGGKLIVFRSAGLPMQFEIPAQAYAIKPADLPAMLKGEAMKSLQELTKNLDPALIEKLRVDVDSPWEGICTAAKDEGADMIVIGTHGYSGLDRLIGTTASKVVNHAPCSVLVVR